MKKLFVLAMALFLVAGVLAQDEQEQTTENKGDSPTMWLGGGVTFGSMSDLDFTLGPSFGILVGKNMGVGGTLLFSSGNSAYEWGVEPYFRYYLPVADQFSFFGDAFFGVGGGEFGAGVSFNTVNFALYFHF